MPFMKANGVNIHYEDIGDPSWDTIVFANSLGTDFRLWDDVLPHLPKRLRIIRYDKRGHGLSECPPYPYSIDDLADDAQALMEKRNVSDCLFVGLSIGGLIAQALMRRSRSRIRAAVLSNTAAKIGSEDMWQSRIVMARANKLAEMAPSIIDRWFSKSFRDRFPEATLGWQAMVSRTLGEGYAGCCHAIMHADFSDEIAHIDQSVWAIAGSEDGATPPEIVRATAALIPHAHYLEIEGVGHLTCVEAPETYAKHLCDILRETFLIKAKGG